MARTNALLLACILLSSLIPMVSAASLIPEGSTCTVMGEDVPCDQFWDRLWGSFGWVLVVGGIVFAVTLAFWLWMLMDCAQRDFRDKAVWILIILLAGILGALVYYFVIRRKDQGAK
jgi:hypothetical protein